MTAALRKPYLSPQEYLSLEREAEAKSEYFQGNIYALAGATPRHTAIVANLLYLLVGQFKGKPCMAHGSDLRVQVSPTGLYTYPDIVVICGNAEFEDRHEDTLLNPNVIFEVLSKSTESYDRGDKFGQYRRLPSLSDYLLVSQTHPVIEHFMRQADDSWILREYRGLDSMVEIRSTSCSLPLVEVYDKLDWPEDEDGSGQFSVLKERGEMYG